MFGRHALRREWPFIIVIIASEVCSTRVTSLILLLLFYVEGKGIHNGAGGEGVGIDNRAGGEGECLGRMPQALGLTTCIAPPAGLLLRCRVRTAPGSHPTATRCCSTPSCK